MNFFNKDEAETVLTTQICHACSPKVQAYGFERTQCGVVASSPIATGTPGHRYALQPCNHIELTVSCVVSHPQYDKYQRQPGGTSSAP